MSIALDTLGREDELRTLHAFLDRPADDGMAALVLEGEAGIGKSTLWLSGVEAAGERGIRVLTSVALAAEMGLRLPAITSIRGFAALWGGDASEAARWFAEADETATGIGLLEPMMRPWRPDHVEALLALGQVREAGELLDEWAAEATRLGRGWALAHVCRCRGLAASAAGDVEHAVSLLEEAVREHERVGDPFGRARALLALGIVRR
jgi:hypothetical protein